MESSPCACPSFRAGRTRCTRACRARLLPHRAHCRPAASTRSARISRSVTCLEATRYCASWDPWETCSSEQTGRSMDKGKQVIIIRSDAWIYFSHCSVRGWSREFVWRVKRVSLNRPLPIRFATLPHPPKTPITANHLPTYKLTCFKQLDDNVVN